MPNPRLDSESNNISNSNHEEGDEDIATAIGNGTAGKHGGAGHRQGTEAVDHPPTQVFGEPNAGLDGTKQHYLHHNSWQKIVNIVSPIGRLDGPAENIGEEQNEHYRLNRGKNKELRQPTVERQIALCYDPNIGENAKWAHVIFD